MAAGDKCNSFGMCSAVAPRIPRRTARSAADAVERTAEQYCVLDVLHVGANFLLPIACSDIARLCRRRDTYTSMGSTLSSLIHQVTWPKVSMRCLRIVLVRELFTQGRACSRLARRTLTYLPL